MPVRRWEDVKVAKLSPEQVAESRSWAEREAARLERAPGAELDPGRVADFWRFWAVREAARLRKGAGAPPPHSDDPVVAAWRFCCCYRDLDAGTRFFAARRGAGLARVLWRSVAYRLLNRRETFEAAELAGAGALWLEPGTLDRWLGWLDERRAGGEPLFTGRHIVRGLAPYARSTQWLAGNIGETVERLEGCVRESSPDTACEVCGAEAGRRCYESDYDHPRTPDPGTCLEGDLKAACAVLRLVPGVGPFFAWQVARDLVEAGELPEDGSWALAGPGARAGAALVASAGAAQAGLEPAPLSERAALGVMLALTDGQEAARAGAGVDASSWHRVPVTLADVEHTLCEFARYEALRTGRAERAKCGRYWDEALPSRGGGESCA